MSEFDNILLIPRYSEVERENVNISSFFFEYKLLVPILSSPMDTISGIEMIKAMWEEGALGVHHRYCSWKELQEASFYNGAIAVAPSMGIDKILNLYMGKNDLIVVLDVAHGHTKHNLDFCKELFENGVNVVSGNIVTPQAVEDYLKVGVKHFRVGIGSGSVCTTRKVAGVGYPQPLAIQSLREEFLDDIVIISDGGHATTGDIVKALALGADFVMLGRMLAGTNEALGASNEFTKDRNYAVYRGMGSKDARENFRSFDGISEGISISVPKVGPVREIIDEIALSIQLGCYYLGAKNLKELREVEIVYL